VEKVSCVGFRCAGTGHRNVARVMGGVKVRAEPTAYPEDDPRHHTMKLHAMLTDVIQHAREDIGKIDEPKAQARCSKPPPRCAPVWPPPWSNTTSANPPGADP
jgi:hypothetical protein